MGVFFCFLFFSSPPTRFIGLLFAGLFSPSPKSLSLLYQLGEPFFMKLRSGASVSCLRFYCQPFRTSSQREALHTSGSCLFPAPIFSSTLLFLCHSAYFVVSSFCSPVLSSLSHYFLLSQALVALLLLLFLSCPFSSLTSLIMFPTPSSLIFLSYQGLMAESDSKSIHRTNDTNTLGRRFTYSAPKAKLSMRP